MSRNTIASFALLSLLATAPILPAQADHHGRQNATSQATDQGKPGQGEGGAGEKTPAYSGPKKRLAVMNTDKGENSVSSEWFKLMQRYGKFHTPDDVGLKLNSMLTTALNNTGRFVLMERQNFEDIRGEQSLMTEGQTTTQTGAQKGSVLGAQVMVRCAITEFVDDSVKEGGAGGVHLPLGIVVGGGSSRKKAKVTVDIKMYDVATSKILYTSTASGNSDSKSSAMGISMFGAGAVFGKSTNDPIEKATRDAITGAVNFITEKMEAITWEGKIALSEKDDDGKMIYVLNRGEADGLKIGDELVVTSPGKEIIDPDTGEKLGRSKDRVIGSCRVVYTDKNVAHVEPMEVFTISKGCVVKLK